MCMIMVDMDDIRALANAGGSVATRRVATGPRARLCTNQDVPFAKYSRRAFIHQPVITIVV